MTKNSLLFCLICLLAVLFSCNKPEDTQPPSLLIHAPTAGESYNALDTLFVDFEVTDDVVVQQVLVELITAAGALAHPGKAAVVCNAGERVTLVYPLDNIHLESGQYYLRFTASDGSNNKSAFVELQLFEVPLALEAVCWIEGGNTLRYGSWPSEETGEVALPSPMSRLYPDRWNRRMVCSSLWGEDLTFVDMQDGTLIQSVAIPNVDELPAIGHFDIHSRRYYHLHPDGWMHVFSSSGSASGGFQIDGNWNFRALTCSQERIAVSGGSGGINVVLFFHKTSGVLMHSVTTPALVTELLDAENRILGITADHQVIAWDGTGTELEDQAAAWDQDLDNVFPLDPLKNTWVLQAENGDLWQLQANPLSSTPLPQTQDVAHLTADWSSAFGIWYGHSGISIDVASGESSQFWIGTTGPVQDLQVLLNK